MARLRVVPSLKKYILAYLRQFDKDELIPNSLQEHLSEAARVLVRQKFALDTSRGRAG
jgi:hypothetical protein